MKISPSSVSEPFQSSVEFPCVPWKLCIQWVDAVCSFTDNEMNLSGSVSAWRVSGKCISVMERRDARRKKQDFSENIFPSPSLIYFLNYKISTFTLKIDRRGRTNWKAIHREFLLRRRVRRGGGGSGGGRRLGEINFSSATLVTDCPFNRRRKKAEKGK